MVAQHYLAEDGSLLSSYARGPIGAKPTIVFDVAEISCFSVVGFKRRSSLVSVE
jgi:hypothetical protein